MFVQSLNFCIEVCFLPVTEQKQPDNRAAVALSYVPVLPFSCRLQPCNVAGDGQQQFQRQKLDTISNSKTKRSAQHQTAAPYLQLHLRLLCAFSPQATVVLSVNGSACGVNELVSKLHG